MRTQNLAYGFATFVLVAAGCTVTHIPDSETRGERYEEPAPEREPPRAYEPAPEREPVARDYDPARDRKPAARGYEPAPEPAPARSRRGGKTLNSYVGLDAFPRSRIIEHEFDGRDSETTFESRASLRRIYRHFHEQLSADGWRRSELEIEDDEIEATYARRGVEFELELEDEGGGVYELEIDVD